VRGIRERGKTVFLTKHLIEEAEGGHFLLYGKRTSPAMSQGLKSHCSEVVCLPEQGQRTANAARPEPCQF
jgi:hypothetical protein